MHLLLAVLNLLSQLLALFGISHSRVTQVEKAHWLLELNGYLDIISGQLHLAHSLLLFANSLDLFLNTTGKRFKQLTKIIPL